MTLRSSSGVEGRMMERRAENGRQLTPPRREIYPLTFDRKSVGRRRYLAGRPAEYSPRSLLRLRYSPVVGGCWLEERRGKMVITRRVKTR